jgi:hypothetical protein
MFFLKIIGFVIILVFLQRTKSLKDRTVFYPAGGGGGALAFSSPED